jgi:2-succinyl-5-enolpyruvyl-6-hydroxy-3-cyclohexene-1-carboxylate synthase
MATVTDTYTLLRAFVDELTRCGMRAACTSPGSRSSPLVLTLAGESRLRCFSHIDERCSGFFALGLAKSTGLPVAVTCTSGTAAAELAPAVIEAREARVPLLVMTADRPAELRENGAGQAIDQIKMFAGAEKWFFEVAVHEAGERELRWMRTLACRAYWTALQGRPGAVHLNFPLREPLVGDLEPAPDSTARPDGRPYLTRFASAAADGPAADRLRELVGTSRRGVLVAGRHERDSPLAAAAAEFARAAGWPLLADPLSGARRGPAAVAHYDALLREPAFASAVPPDLVLRVGDLPVSGPLRGWLAGLDAEQVALDAEDAWQDPDCVVGSVLELEPAAALADLAGALQSRCEDGWAKRWRAADLAAARAIEGEIGREVLSEPAVAAELGRVLPPDATLFVASSMPVRDIESFWTARDDPPRVLCNRGANGIDGTVSSAFGAAAGGDGPVVLLIGDVALAHDIGGLLAARRLDLSLTIVLLQNEGGGIFDFLPVSRSGLALRPDASAPGEQDIYTRHVLTPTGLDFSGAAALYGLSHQVPRDIPALRSALGLELERPGSGIIEVRCARAENVALHARIWRAVAEELSRSAAAAGPAA